MIDNEQQAINVLKSEFKSVLDSVILKVLKSINSDDTVKRLRVEVTGLQATFMVNDEIYVTIDVLCNDSGGASIDVTYLKDIH